MPDAAPYATSPAPACVHPVGSDRLMVCDWPLPAGHAMRGVALLVHGLGEHAGRYGHVAAFLNAQGFAVRAYDQYGHGQSPGRRGDIRHAGHLLEGLGEMVRTTKAEYGERTPLLLLGHSMGGLVAARWVAQQQAAQPGPVQALVLSSPALGLYTNVWQKALLHIAPRVAPHLCVGNGLEVHDIARNAATIQSYQQDALVHDRISALLGGFMWRASAAVQAAAADWRIPTLLMYAGADRLVDPAASRMFATHAPAGVVQPKEWAGYFHEIFNEPEAERAAVLDWFSDWLNRCF